MKTKMFLIVLSLLYHSVIAQFDSTAYKYAQTINKNDIEKIIYTLASDSMMGRNTATEGQKRAESYLIEEINKIGLEPGNGDSYVQKFSVYKKDFLTIELNVDDTEIKNENYFSISGVKGSELESDAIVFAGYGINNENFNDYKNIEAKGKSIFILQGEPTDNDGNSWINGKEKSEWKENLELKINAARLAEASVLFIIVENYKDFKSRYEYWISMGALSLDDKIEEKFIPIVYIDKSTFTNIFGISDKKFKNYLKKISTKGEPKSIEINKHLKLNIKGENIMLASSNVLAVIEGTDLKKSG